MFSWYLLLILRQKRHFLSFQYNALSIWNPPPPPNPLPNSPTSHPQGMWTFEDCLYNLNFKHLFSESFAQKDGTVLEKLLNAQKPWKNLRMNSTRSKVNLVKIPYSPCTVRFNLINTEGKGRFWVYMGIKTSWQNRFMYWFTVYIQLPDFNLF